MTIKFAMFIVMIVGVLASQWIMNSESYSAAKSESQASGLPGVTGLVTEDLTPSTGVNVTLAILFLIISVYLVYRSQERKYLLKLEKELNYYAKYSSLILRLALGAVFVWQAFIVTVIDSQMFLGIIYIIVGMMLILGLFTRIAAYVCIFLLLKQLFAGMNPLFFVLLIANAVMVLLLGSGTPSFDEDVRKNKS